jgi:hypothetical protein
MGPGCGTSLNPPEDGGHRWHPYQSGGAGLAFHDDGRLRELRLARSHSVLGRRYDAGTLLRFDRDGRLTYVQPQVAADRVR